MTLGACICRAEESAYYKSFLSAVAPGDMKRPTLVSSSLLVDTNNTDLKVSGGHTNSLLKMWGRGEVAGISLRMSMSDVIAQWGKPERLWSTCGGGPRMVYHDVSLVFHKDVLSEIIIFPRGKKGWFESGLNTVSRAKDFVGVLGRPHSRKGPARSPDVLHYESPGQMFMMSFQQHGGQLQYIRLLTTSAGLDNLY